MSDLATLDAELNTMIIQGQTMEAFERFYADDVVMQENSEEPTSGKDACRQREIEFFSSVQEFHGATLVSSGIGDGVTFGEWEYSITFKGAPGPTPMAQIARRQWRDGKVVHERFYYSKG